MAQQPDRREILGALSTGRPWPLDRLGAAAVPTLIGWLAIAFGCGLRLRYYLADRSLWLDEALLAMNVVGRPLRGLLLPLSDSQAAPLGFLLASHATVRLLGDSELTLRLVPLLAGLCALLLFRALATRLLDPWPAALACGLFAIARPQVYYAAEFKPYSLDVAVALLIWLIGLGLVGRPTVARAAVAAAAGAILAWCSFPAVFVLAGVGLTLAIDAGLRRDRAAILAMGGVGLAWGGSFAASYLLFARHLTSNRFLNDFWSRSFMPLPPNSLSDLRWLLDHFIGMFGLDVAGFVVFGLAAFCFLAGCAVFAGRRPQLWLMLAPLLLTLLASGLRRYPFDGRLILFLAPMLLIVVAAGAAQIWRLAGGGSRLIGPALATLLLLGQLIETRGLIAAPAIHEDLRPVLATVAARREPGDAIYVYYGAKGAFRYYGPRLGIDQQDVIMGAEVRDSMPMLAADLDRLRGRGRAWVVFAHVHRTGGIDEELFGLYHLDQIGRRIFQVERHDAAAYLYELSP